MVPERRVDLKVIEGRGPRGGATPVRPSWARLPGDADSEPGLRPVDALFVGYLLGTAVLILTLRNRLPGWPLYLALRLAAVALVLRLVPLRPRNRALASVRDWYPVAAFVPLYAELGGLTHLFTSRTHDGFVSGLEGRLFGFQPSQMLHLLWPWPWLSEYLHFCYFYYYLVPLTLGLLLYLRGRRPQFSQALTAILGVFVTCCAIFIAFPVAGPYHYFGHAAPASLPGFFGPLVHGIVDRGSSVGTAFPSSHTAVAVCVWVTAWRLSRPAFWALAPVVPGLALATVYGGFHYALDTLAGVVLGAQVALWAPRIHAAIRARMAGPPAGNAPRVSLPRAGGVD